ncbi:ribosomal protein L17 [Scheffersomyces xylosifermentans]|uniref:ribosomal protein L17 n=1 Tax=Scheffersomyces xylosifermentans TaxID=1304137 RepID=UPI00315CFBAB
MPALQKFHANVARHAKSIDKNLCANLIRHEYIVTTRAKAKRAQPTIEAFLADALKTNESISQEIPLNQRIVSNRALNYLQPPDKFEVGGKIIQELAERYPTRRSGFTRIIKLEPRLGEDKAPMSVIELVDSEYEVKFWFTAKIVARLQLQNLPLDDITQLNVNKLTKFRKGGEEAFAEAVETCKVEFFKYDPETGSVTDEAAKKNLENLPTNLEYYGGSLSGTLLASKKFKTQPRQKQESGESVIPPSPFLAKE